MDNENMKNSIGKDERKSPKPPFPNDETNSQENLYKEDGAHPQTDNKKPGKKKFDKSLKIFGGICIAASILAITFMGSSPIDTSESAKNALINKVSTGVSAGSVLMRKDGNTTPQDYTINHKSQNKDTKIWVWDYAAEDGDYVQVLVNGTPVTEAFMIKHKPRELTVPATGQVQIKGIRDGGGGITYAIRYEVNGTSYFNGTSEGEPNTYTLTRE